MNKIMLVMVCIVIPSFLFAQNVNGVVTDGAGESLAFVNIIINDDNTRGVIADLDGRFVLEDVGSIETLTLSYMGYETLIYRLTNADRGKGELKLVLTTSDFGLQEVLVKAGENPAHRIIRLAVKNKRQNNHEKLQSYQCEIYSKMQVGQVLTDSIGYLSAKEKLDSLNKISKSKEKYDTRSLGMFDIHFLVSEIVTERYFKAPETIRNKLLHNRVSGMDKLDLSVMNSFQQFTFYDDYIFFGEESFVNPISKGSTSRYFFNIQDTLYQEQDTVFIVSYKPKKGKVFEGLKGAVYINSNGYAIQNVLAEPADANATTWKLEHQYVFSNDEHWFPSQMNFEIRIPDSNSEFAELRLKQKGYISKVKLNPIFSNKELKDDFISLKGEIISKEDEIWEDHRAEELSEKDKRSYHLLDSIGEKHNLDFWMNTAFSFAGGNLQIGEIDLRWKDVMRINDFEKVRLGVGLQTNKLFSRHISFGGYVGYGFRDKRFKYGGNVIWDIVPDDILELKYAYSFDIQEPGVFKFPLQGDQFLSRSIYAQIMDTERKHSLGLQSQYRFLRAGLTLERTRLNQLYPYLYSGENATNSLFNTFTEASFNLRYAYGENNDWFMGIRVPQITRFPILFFSYTKGFKNVLGGDFDYHKVSGALEQRFNTRFLGETRYRIEGGIVKGGVPYSRLFVGSGSGSGSFAFLSLDNTFQTMDNYEFLSDRFMHLFFQHDFGNILIRKKYSRPSLLLLHNMGFGTLENPEDHQVVNTQTMEKGFYESGAGLDNIVVVPMRQSFNLGFGLRAYYRYGAYALPREIDNLAMRFNMSIVF